jgi:radical SAM superfamily enzyme YgiQ (UPF0313 family)
LHGHLGWDDSRDSIFVSEIIYAVVYEGFRKRSIRMKKVLLISLPYKPNYMRNARCDFVSWSGTQWYPMLLGYLGAYLESKGYQVKILDAQAYNMTGREVNIELEVFHPDYICIYAGDESFPFDLRVAQIWRQRYPNTKLIGPFYSLNSNKYKEAGIEGGLEDGVLSWIEGKVDPVNPIIGRHLTGLELDGIPFASEFFLKHLKYQYYHTPSEPYPFVDILTSRGCFWGKCSFCLWPRTYKQGYTERSLLNVMREIEFIEKRTPFKSIMIEDDSFSAERAWCFSNEKILWGLKIPWSCLVRANIEYFILLKMKQANCLNLHVGYESANPQTLLKVNKGISVAQMEEFTGDAKRAGLKIHGDFLLGIDETEEEVKNTIDWACKLKPDTAQFQIYIPYFEKCHWDPEKLKVLGRYAYRKFYVSFHGLKAISRQFLKPKILYESINAVFFKVGKR